VLVFALETEACLKKELLMKEAPGEFGLSAHALLELHELLELQLTSKSAISGPWNGSRKGSAICGLRLVFASPFVSVVLLLA